MLDILVNMNGDNVSLSKLYSENVVGCLSGFFYIKLFDIVGFLIRFSVILLFGKTTNYI